VKSTERDQQNPLPIRIAKSALAGLAGGVLFAFLFPKGAITTLVHDVVELPGPGAGIALVKGPLAIFFALVAAYWAGGRAAALSAILSYSLVMVVAANLFGIDMNPKGMFGSAWFVLAFVVLGLSVELLLWLTRKAKPVWRCVITAAGANLLLLVAYWLIVFPWLAGWVAWKDVPLLAAVSLAGGLLAGLVAWLVARLI
jgi:hypothetical protein